MVASLTIIISYLGALLVVLTSPGRVREIRWVALITTILGLVTAICCAMRRVASDGGFQDVTQYEWIPVIGASFHLGVDGISLPMILVTGIVAVCGVLMSWRVEHRANEFFAYYLALIGGVYGTFLSMDLFLLFVFYEIAIIPKYFMIAIWGSGRKGYAAMKLALYSFGGSALVLFGILAAYFGSGLETFDLFRLTTEADFSEEFQAVFFAVTFLGFAILAGMWPFHTWAPTGHAAAPVAVSMLLAGIVMKLGAYGCLRVAVGLFPAGAYFWAPAIAWLAVINIVYGALVALNQRDFKFVIGYSSVSHMGFVLLGFAALNQHGLNGAVLQMFSHGVLGAALFALVGGVIYVRTKTRQLGEFHRLADRMPGVAWTFVVAGLASMGLPGFSGFVSELYVLIGVWKADHLGVSVLVVSGLGILLAFGYVLVKTHEAFFRKNPAVTEEEAATTYEPMTCPEKVACFLLLGSSLAVGLYPTVLTQWIEPSLKPILDNVDLVVK
jgi:NADH-quinone oxidoreductase subunit M